MRSPICTAGRASQVCALLFAAWPAATLAHAPPGAGSFDQAPIWFTQALFALAWMGYAAGAIRRRPQSGPCLAFHLAMLISGLALFGPLDELAGYNVAWHMVQHMLLIVVVAPLLVLARPLPQWRAVLGSSADVVWRPLHRLSRRPMLCALLHAAALWFWHAPGPYIAAEGTPLWHVLEHSCFLLSGWLFWWSVLRPGRLGALPAAGALLFTVMHTGLLGGLLSFASVPLYSTKLTALAEQQLAGLIMWIPGGFAYLLAVVWAAWGALASQEAVDASQSSGRGAPRTGSRCHQVVATSPRD